MKPMAFAEMITQSSQVLRSDTEATRQIARFRDVVISAQSFRLERSRGRLHAIADSLRGARR
jgi:hypothetical protein